MADTKIPNTCTVCHHLMQQVTSWRGESEIVNHLFSTFIFFFSPSAKKNERRHRESRRRGMPLSLCQVSVPPQRTPSANKHFVCSLFV